MARPKQLLTRCDWDKRFGFGAALLATVASIGTIALDYHALWLAFAMLVPLYLLVRFSTPSRGYQSPQVSRWSLAVIPILFVILPITAILVRHMISGLLQSFP